MAWAAALQAATINTAVSFLLWCKSSLQYLSKWIRIEVRMDWKRFVNFSYSAIIENLVYLWNHNRVCYFLIDLSQTHLNSCKVTMCPQCTLWRKRVRSIRPFGKLLFQCPVLGLLRRFRFACTQNRMHGTWRCHFRWMYQRWSTVVYQQIKNSKSTVNYRYWASWYCIS